MTDGPVLEILRDCWREFGEKAVASSSFQTQSVPLLHMISRACPDMPVVFLDTGYHFPETLSFRDELTKSMSLNVKIVYPDDAGWDSRDAAHSPLYLSNPDHCCRIRKLEPMRHFLMTWRVQAWVSGIRRDQTEERRSITVRETGRDGIERIHPLCEWAADDVADYIDRYGLPAHPLKALGYETIGCAPCTTPVGGAEDIRAGRWRGLEKLECGLHNRDECMKRRHQEEQQL
jgi:phosphoadenosine phosphosulfate reductase